MLVSIIVLLIGFVLGVIIAWMIWGGKVRRLEALLNQKDRASAAKDAELKALQEQLSQRENELNNHKLLMEQTELKQRQNESEKKLLGTELAVAKDQIGQLRSSLSANESKIKTLEGQLISNKTKPGRPRKETSLHEDELEGIAAMQSTYNATLTKLKGLEKKMTDLVNDNNTLRSTIAAMEKNAGKSAETMVGAPVKKKKDDDKKGSKKKKGIVSKPVREKSEDLKIIEGVGPKIEKLLQKAGISTLKELSETSVDRLRHILSEAGSQYRIHDPSSWAQQAKFAASGELDKLKEYQAFLVGGRNLSE